MAMPGMRATKNIPTVKIPSSLNRKVPSSGWNNGGYWFYLIPSVNFWQLHLYLILYISNACSKPLLFSVAKFVDVSCLWSHLDLIFQNSGYLCNLGFSTRSDSVLEGWTCNLEVNLATCIRKFSGTCVVLVIAGIVYIQVSAILEGFFQCRAYRPDVGIWCVGSGQF